MLTVQTIVHETLAVRDLQGYRPSAVLMRALSGLYGCYVEMLDQDTVSAEMMESQCRLTNVRSDCLAASSHG
jgi:hypothetical protein